MVSNNHIMDGQRQHYLPGPPPLQQQQQQGNLSHIPPPPPPPRSYQQQQQQQPQQQQQQQQGLPPPPPVPHPSTLPAGTVYGFQPGWQQSWGRPGVNPGLPPPPPISYGQVQNPGYGSMVQRQPGQVNIPPPPPQNDKPLVSATFIPGGDSFGPGVGIPPFEDYTSMYLRYDGTPSSEHPPISLSADAMNREARSASASSHRAPLTLALRESSPISPGPPTATLRNPQPPSRSEAGSIALSGRQRAQSAAVGFGNDRGSQWPLERVIAWLAANGFSHEWQDTFRTLKIEGHDFLDLGGRGGRGHLGKMYQVIYPHLAKISQGSGNGGWDGARERDEGKRLRKLVAAIVDSESGSMSAGSGHRRRESTLLTSASTDGTIENSPNLGSAQFISAPGASGDGESPGKQLPSSLLNVHGLRDHHPRSNTLPVHSKNTSNSSTPSETRLLEGIGTLTRSDYGRNTLNGISRRGRHSPALSGDSSQGLMARHTNQSPNESPNLSHAAPAPQASVPNLLTQRSDPAKVSTPDSALKARASSGNIMAAEGTGRFYESRRDGQDMSRDSPIDGPRPYGDVEYVPGPGGRDHSKTFLSKFMRNRKQDMNYASTDEQAMDHPTSPASFRQMLPFTNRGVNASDPLLAQRPISATAGIESERADSKSRQLPRAGRRYMFVTPDHWNYRLIDVTELDSASKFRSRIIEELGLSLSEGVQIYLTEPGLIDHDMPLNEQSLMMAHNDADATGMVKLYVQIGPASIMSAPISGSQQMAKSNSSSGITLPPFPSAPEFNTPEALHKAASEWRRQTELKQRAYLESRQQRKDSTQQASAVGRGTIIDFDAPRVSPYEDKKMEILVPVRKPPTAPSESNTLTKVNSLRTKPGENRNRSSLEALKRISDPVVEDSDRGRRKGNGSLNAAGGIGAALANVGRLAGAPATYGGQSRGSDTGASPRPNFTWAKGNLQFKVPDYDQTSGSRNTPAKPQHPSLHALRKNIDAEASPVSPASDYPPRPGLGRVKSFGPDYEFKETHVTFAQSSQPEQPNDSDDDDSDDGLFSIPLANRSIPKENSQEAGPKERPVLSVDTDQHPSKSRAVAFKSPHSSTETHSEPARSGEESAGYSRSADRLDSASFSATSPNENGRPDSFISDIWANRPAIENVVDHLDAFFPGVDLDKPYVEESGENPTPITATDRHSSDGSASLNTSAAYSSELPFNYARLREDTDTLGSDESTLKESNKSKVASYAQRQLTKSGGSALSRAKSIRQRAQKANELSHVPSVAARFQNNEAGGMMRRKSTKMFGANIVQIKPKKGNRVSILDSIPQEDTPADGTPKRQATFKIIRGQLIGKGTYGRVYLGMNATTGEFLAVKQVEVNHKAAGLDKDRIKEMVSALDIEIDTMQHLEHPNIVQYLGCERKEFSISIYLEYIPGGSIGSCLRKHGKFEESVVRSLTQQTLNGLAYLHREGILHRDLKADNILLDLDGTSKISDFGISKRSDNIYGNDVTNSMQGSVFWMAPEVVRAQGQGYSAKVDIWSLGCVVLEMFAGKRPWSREEAIGAIFKLGSLNQAPPIPDDVQATASVDGLNFMYDCFQVDPNDRPTAETLLRHSSFCVPDKYYNFYDTNLAAKLRTADAAPTGL